MIDEQATPADAGWQDNQWQSGDVYITAGEGAGQCAVIVNGKSTEMHPAPGWQAEPEGA